MNDITLFDYQNYKVRTVSIDGNIWFVAKDVCDVLGIVDQKQAISRLDTEDERGVYQIPTLKGLQQMVIISEAGLYHLVLTSEKKEAKTFRRWVLHDVLPEIRKKGYYGSPLPKYIKRCSLNADRIEQGYFSVIHELSFILGLKVEDSHHIIMQDKAPDGKDICPDISVGILFSTYLKKNYPEYVGCFKFYTHKYPVGREVQARQYENRVLGIFKDYVELFWLKDRAPKYFSDKDPKIAEVLQKQLK